MWWCWRSCGTAARWCIVHARKHLLLGHVLQQHRHDALLRVVRLLVQDVDHVLDRGAALSLCARVHLCVRVRQGTSAAEGRRRQEVEAQAGEVGEVGGAEAGEGRGGEGGLTSGCCGCPSAGPSLAATTHMFPFRAAPAARPTRLLGALCSVVRVQSLWQKGCWAACPMSQSAEDTMSGLRLG